MATAPEPRLMTVDEFRQLPARPDCVQELHWGEVVTLTFPKKRHTRIQNHLLELLRAAAGNKGFLAAELPFRAMPEYELRAADVAFVSQARWDATDEDDNLHGAPELVIEVLSPSNTEKQIREKAALCLAAGTEEFLIVNPKLRTVTVLQRNSPSRLDAESESIRLATFGTTINVAAIF